MYKEKEARLYDGPGPVVVKSCNYQQPVEEAMEQTREAIRVCNSMPSAYKGKRNG